MRSGKRNSSADDGRGRQAERLRGLLESAALPEEERPAFDGRVLAGIRAGIARRRQEGEEFLAPPLGAFALRLLPAALALAFALCVWAGWEGRQSEDRGGRIHPATQAAASLLGDVLFGLPAGGPQGGAQ